MTKSQRAFLAGAVWVVIGLMLIVRGWMHWEEFGSSDFPALPLVIGAVIGLAKGFFVIRKSAGRMIRRIEEGPDKQPLWRMYPPYLYLLIPLMIGLGLGLKALWGEEHPALILAVYAGIGCALLGSCTPFFSAAARLSPAAST